MKKKQPNQPRKQPQQQRSKLLVRSIVEAGMVLLEEGDSEFTIEKLCQRAGVSAGSFYQYFPDREAVVSEIFRAIVEREWQILVDGFAQSQAMSFEDGIEFNARSGLSFFRKLHQLDPDFYQMFGSSYLPFESLEGGVPLIKLFEERIRDQFITLFKKHPDALSMSEHELEQMAFVYGQGSIAILKTILDERPQYLYDDAFMARLTRLMSQGWMLV